MDPLITNGIDPGLLRVIEKRGQERRLTYVANVPLHTEFRRMTKTTKSLTRNMETKETRRHPQMLRNMRLMIWRERISFTSATQILQRNPA